MGIQVAVYNLIAVDMDGTLLNSEHHISLRGKQAIKDVLQRGKQVVFATGRCLAEMGEYLAEFPDMRYLICENGASVVDLKEKRNLYRAPLDPALTERVIRAVEKEDVLVSFFIGNRSFMDAAGVARLAEYGLEGYVDVLENTLVRVPSLFAFYRDNPLEAEKITLYFKDASTRNRVKGKLSGMPLQLAGSIAGNLEISASGVNKGAGLRKLCESLNLPLSEVIAVGDGNNDREMLQAAGLPVAMANAVPELKRFAKRTAPDCDHDGAAVIIEEYM